MSLPVNRVTWRPCWRIIPSRFPPISIFERVTDPDDLEAVIELEAMTDDRVRDQVGELRLVPPEDRIAGPGTSAIMSAFTHPNPEGSRFSDGGYGVFYAGADLDTAISETRHQRERFMRATQQGRMELDMRVYVTDLDGALHDIRGTREAMPAVYHLDDYGASQHLAKKLRRENSWGIAYHSVRHEGGECTAVFRPPVLYNCRRERHLCYVWDGRAISAVFEKRSFGA